VIKLLAEIAKRTPIAICCYCEDEHRCPALCSSSSYARRITHVINKSNRGWDTMTRT